MLDETRLYFDPRDMTFSALLATGLKALTL